MTKERLKELIKQSGTVYKISYGEVWKMPLINDEKNHCDISCDKFLHFHELLEFNDSLDNRWTDYYVGLDELFESKEEAEWICKMHAERNERFEPPMWEDLKVYFEEIDYKFAFATNCHCVYTFIVGVGDNGGIIELNKFSVYKPDLVCVYKAEATKENYEKACEIVRDLFGGKNER